MSLLRLLITFAMKLLHGVLIAYAVNQKRELVLEYFLKELVAFYAYVVVVLIKV